MAPFMAPVMAWRHPRPQDVAGRCIGRTDVQVDPRKVRRLARRIERHARRHGMPHVVCTSPLQRCLVVGRCLRRRGWVHHVDAALSEMDFGRWDGYAWRDIPWDEVQAWGDDFVDHAPGGGESLRQMLQRVTAWVPPVSGCAVVGHGGWMLCRRWLLQHGCDHLPRSAADWPSAPAYGQGWALAQ